MKNLPANIVMAKNELSTTSAWLIMLDINLNNVEQTVLRYVRNNENITFDGDLYKACNFELEPTEQSSGGEIPSVTLRVSNVSHLLRPYLEELDGGIGSTVKVTVINSDLLDEDYTELEMTFDVIDCNRSAQWITFTLGAPNPLRQMLLLDKYLALHCNWHFNDVVLQQGFECDYAGKDIEGITLSGSNPVSVQITGHTFTTGDFIKFADIVGTTELNGNSYIVTVTDADNFTLDGTDSSMFSAYVSAGKAGYASCSRTLADCRIRGNKVNFGGSSALRSGGVVIA